MTEFEINKKVAEKLGFRAEIRESGTWIFNKIWIPFDPCNEPGQAWEIMTIHNICVTKSKGKYISFYNLEFENSDDGYVPDIETQNAKPLVAAMLVFLEI